MGLHHVVLTTPETFFGKTILTAVEMQPLLDIDKTDPREDFFCLKWTFYSRSREMCVIFETDTHELNIVIYRY